MFSENVIWSYGQYGHFACSTLPKTKKKVAIPTRTSTTNNCRTNTVGHINIYGYIYIYIYIYILHTEKYINYTDNQQIWFCIEDMNLTGKYHIKLTCSWKPWNGHTVTTVILPVALCLKHRRTCKGLETHIIVYKILYIKTHILSQTYEFSKVWANRSHTPWEYFAPYQTISSAI